MPTVFRRDGFRFFIHSNEGNEPLHVHVAQAERRAKFRLGPDVELVWSYGFRRNELSAIKRIVLESRDRLKDAWNERFGRP